MLQRVQRIWMGDHVPRPHRIFYITTNNVVFNPLMLCGEILYQPNHATLILRLT